MQTHNGSSQGGGQDQVHDHAHEHEHAHSLDYIDVTREEGASEAILVPKYEEPTPPPVQNVEGAEDRMARELSSVKQNLEGRIAQMEMQIIGMMQQEIGKVFDNALNRAQGSVTGSTPEYPTVQAPQPTTTPVEEPVAESPTMEAEEQETPEELPEITSEVDEAEEAEAEEASKEPPTEVEWDDEDEPEIAEPAHAEADAAIEEPDEDADLVSMEEGGSGSEDVYTGTVRLNIESQGNGRQVVDFVNELCQNSHFRLLRLVGDRYREGANVWLELRESLVLRTLLRRMNGVRRVGTPLPLPANTEERQITVWLTEAAIPAGIDG